MNRLCVHSITTKPWSLEECLRHYPAAGVSALTLWRNHLVGRDATEVGRQVREAGLELTSLCRGGFFPAADQAGRQAAIDDNRRCIEEAAALGAGWVVLVCGALPGQSLDQSRAQIAEGIAAVLPAAQAAGVALAIEPLHPMYADDRSAINTMAQANALCDELGSPRGLGIALDVYHVWWDPDLRRQIQISAQAGRLLAFHICDWLTPTTDLLNDRGLMGEGCIPIAEISRWVDEAGFAGMREVEIFSNRRWAGDQQAWLGQIVDAYRCLYPR